MSRKLCYLVIIIGTLSVLNPSSAVLTGMEITAGLLWLTAFFLWLRS